MSYLNPRKALDIPYANIAETLNTLLILKGETAEREKLLFINKKDSVQLG